MKLFKKVLAAVVVVAVLMCGAISCGDKEDEGIRKDIQDALASEFAMDSLAVTYSYSMDMTYKESGGASESVKQNYGVVKRRDTANAAYSLEVNDLMQSGSDDNDNSTKTVFSGGKLYYVQTSNGKVRHAYVQNAQESAAQLFIESGLVLGGNVGEEWIAVSMTEDAMPGIIELIDGKATVTKEASGEVKFSQEVVASDVFNGVASGTAVISGRLADGVLTELSVAADSESFMMNTSAKQHIEYRRTLSRQVQVSVPSAEFDELSEDADAKYVLNSLPNALDVQLYRITNKGGAIYKIDSKMGDDSYSTSRYQSLSNGGMSMTGLQSYSSADFSYANVITMSMAGGKDSMYVQEGETKYSLNSNDTPNYTYRKSELTSRGKSPLLETLASYTGWENAQITRTQTGYEIKAVENDNNITVSMDANGYITAVRGDYDGKDVLETYTFETMEDLTLLLQDFNTDNYPLRQTEQG